MHHSRQHWCRIYQTAMVKHHIPEHPWRDGGMTADHSHSWRFNFPTAPLKRQNHGHIFTVILFTTFTTNFRRLCFHIYCFVTRRPCAYVQITLHTSTSNCLQNTTNPCSTSWCYAWHHQLLIFIIRQPKCPILSSLVDFFSRNCLCHISIIWLSSLITLMGAVMA